MRGRMGGMTETVLSVLVGACTAYAAREMSRGCPSLRTLLIAMTLVAVVLGAFSAVYHM
jgi:hypothetical protein